jgi:class 3 adenylate cyclase
MAGRHLVNHSGRVTETVVEQIKASDLLKLMDVVHEATGLYNALEQMIDGTGGAFERLAGTSIMAEYAKLGNALRALGLTEVPRDAG